MNKSNILILCFSFLTVATLLSSCESSTSNLGNSPALPNDKLPVIKADSHHDFANKNSHIGETPPVFLRYEIAAGIGLVLDISGYEIKPPSRYQGLGITHPNKIIIEIRVYNAEAGSYGRETYYIDWMENETLFILTTQTLKPEKGKEPFTGFKSGQSVVVLIGFSDGLIYPFWAAGIDIK